jgi:single-stranded-DNA-specific exonuclease
MNISLKFPKLPSSLEELEEVLLGVRSIEDKKKFFHPPTPLKLSPSEVGIDAKGIQKALARLLKAKESREQIVVYGDYDADGICASAIVWQTLNSLGFKVMPYIPSRQKHGYGLSRGALEEVIEKFHPSVIVTVDNGIVAHEEIEWLAEQGVEVILTDHHQLEKNKAGDSIEPKAVAIVHSTKLCGATVAWMLMRELVAKLKEDEDLVVKQLDLCGIATIADQVPLQDANRSFAFHGLEQLRQTTRPGLLELYDLAKVELEKITEQTVGFIISPRINAMGRMAHGLDALRLLCTGSRRQARQIAKNLESVNQERKNLTYELMEKAVEMAKEQAEESIIVVHHDDFHEGVIGLVAGRLMEKFYKPAVVIGTAKNEKGDGNVAKASVRSVEGVHITEFLRQIKKDLLSLGGHPLAAGFSLERDMVAEVKEKIQKLAKEQIDSVLLQDKMVVDCELPHDLVTLEAAKLVETLKPFGKKNTQPVFLIKDLKLEHVRQIGKENMHLMLFVKPSSDSSEQIPVLMWRHGFRAPEIESHPSINLVCMLDINTWREKTNLQLVAKKIGFD